MNYYKEIKQELINNEIYKRAKDYSKNKKDLETYYNVGKLLVEEQKEKPKYGEEIIKEYSKRLTKELGKGYTYTSLFRMKQFYILSQNIATMSQQLTWSHYCELLPLNNLNKIHYYINQTIEQTLSVRELRNKIKNNEYERLPKETKNKLINKEENNIEDFLKNPILIKNIHNYQKISEKILKKLILEDLDDFLTELGEGFTYI